MQRKGKGKKRLEGKSEMKISVAAAVLLSNNVFLSRFEFVFSSARHLQSETLPRHT